LGVGNNVNAFGSSYDARMSNNHIVAVIQ